MRRQSVLLLALIALATVVRLPGMLEPLWFDELWATRLAVGNLSALGVNVLGDIHPPLYAVLMFGWIHIFGDSELSIRLPPLIAGVATVAMMPALGRRLASERAGWIAAVLLALSPVHIWYSQEARSYAVFMLLSVGTVLAAARVAQSDDSHRWGSRFLVLALALALTHYFGLILLGIIGLWSFGFPAKARREVLIALVSCVAVVAAYLYFKTQVSPLRTEVWYLGAFTLDSVPGLLRWLLAGSWSSSPFPAAQRVLVMLGAALVVIGLVRRAPGQTSRIVLPGLVLGIPLALLLLGVVGFEHYYIDRSALGTLPFLLLAVAAGTESLVNMRTLHAGALLALAWGSVASTRAYLRGRETLTVTYPNPDWRSALPILQEYRRANGNQRAVLLSPTPLEELRYYQPGSRRCRIPAQTGSSGSVSCIEALDATSGNHHYILPAATTDQVHRILAAEATTSAMLVVRRFWPAHAEALVQAIRDDTSLTIASAGAVRGLDFWRLGVR